MRDPIREQPVDEPIGMTGRMGGARRGQRMAGPRPWTRWQDWGNLLLGAWFFVAPWVLNTTHETTYRTTPWNNWWAGAVIFLVSLWLLARPTARWGEWLNAALGVWLFISPWVLGIEDVGRAAWDAWIVGALVFILAAWVIARANSGRLAMRRGSRGTGAGAL